jgi:SAM-dependent methyltransferase
VRPLRFTTLALTLAVAVAPAGAATSQNPAPARTPDVIFLATDPAVVKAMLALARVTARDVVYDLGCGDGRIVIAAARTYGARGVGIDIDPARIAEANAAARTAGVADKVAFQIGDIFDPAVKIGDATVVTLFLLPDVNRRLRPRLWNDLRPGTRVVSNSFDMGVEWPPDKTAQIGTFAIYLWTVPKR